MDVLDTVHKWYESAILQERDNKFFVHYIGWSSNWDEWIDKNSSRLGKIENMKQRTPKRESTKLTVVRFKNI